jgi:hypothetical protein
MKRKRFSIDFNPEEETNHTLFTLLKLVVENLRLNFSYDNSSFIQNDFFEKLSEPLAGLVTLT